MLDPITRAANAVYRPGDARARTKSNRLWIQHRKSRLGEVVTGITRAVEIAVRLVGVERLRAVVQPILDAVAVGVGPLAGEGRTRAASLELPGELRTSQERGAGSRRVAFEHLAVGVA